jgi:serine/threonine protein kinase
MPSRIGRYRIVARIGRGAMGVVYSAVDEVMGRQIALKVLMADLETEPETRARFYREAQAAARLLHPNIITVHDAGEEQGRSYIAMQLLQGAALAAYLKRPEAAPLERKLDLMVQVCEGLAAAHAHGIIHRDLKPNNLFVESDGLLKILDFGVARFTDSSMTAAGTMLGTPDYMSPEQARGAQVDARSDIFSAGAVFYFMLAGHKPFPGPDLPAVLHQLQHEEAAPLRGVPPDLTAIVTQAMAKDPERRPARVEQLLASLVRFRRQYQAETRRQVFSVRARFEEVENLVRSLDEAGAALGLKDIAPAEALHRLRESFPSFSNRATTVEPSSFERTAVNAVMEAVEAQRANLASLLETRQAHVATLQHGRRMLDSGDAVSALATFEAVLEACPGAARAGELAGTCRPLAREQEERAARINSLIDAAQSALQTHNWAAAAAHSHEVLTLEGGHPVAADLLREAERAIAQEQQRIAAIIQRLVDRASDAIGRRSFEEAEAALREAEGIQRDNPGIAAARQHLIEERAAAEAEARLRRRSAEEIRRARAVFRRGRYDEAVQQLRAFLELEPDAQEAAIELENLVTLNAAIAAAAETSRGHVKALLNTATGAARDGRLDEAILATREALGWDPASADASQMLDMLFRHQLEARLAQERTQMREQRSHECAPLVAAARDAFDRGYVAAALDAALAARRIAPDHPEIGPLIEKAQQELNSDDAHPFELASLPWPEAGPSPTKPAKGSEEGGMLDWAAHLFRGGLRRRKA